MNIESLQEQVRNFENEIILLEEKQAFETNEEMYENEKILYSLEAENDSLRSKVEKLTADNQTLAKENSELKAVIELKEFEISELQDMLLELQDEFRLVKSKSNANLGMNANHNADIKRLKDEILKYEDIIREQDNVISHLESSESVLDDNATKDTTNSEKTSSSAVSDKINANMQIENAKKHQLSVFKSSTTKKTIKPRGLGL